MSPGSQRWLKTVLHTIGTVDAGPEVADEVEVTEAGAAQPEAGEETPRAAASLEDVISGEADLREHLAAYPDLAEELEGLADIIDMLREAGERRRKRGEQILREEILGEPAEAEDEEERA
jgi:hypothetical protein